MFHLLIRLLCLVAIHQRASSADVDVQCSDVEVTAGRPVTLNCSLNLRKCKSLGFIWTSSDQDCYCKNGDSNTTKYGCGWNNPSNVYLTIADVTKAQRYTVTISTVCGQLGNSASANVTLVGHNALSKGSTERPNSAEDRALAAPLLATMAVVGILLMALIVFLRRRIHRNRNDRDRTQSTESIALTLPPLRLAEQPPIRVEGL